MNDQVGNATCLRQLLEEGGGHGVGVLGNPAYILLDPEVGQF